MMRPLAVTVLAVFLASTAWCGAQELRTGFAAPLSGPSERLGRQMLQGAEAAAAAFSQGSLELVTVDDGCGAEGGAAAARRFVEAQVTIATGFLCTEAIEAAMPILAQAGIPVITPAIRTDSLTDLRERTHWPVYRLGPRADAERDAVSRILTQRWRDVLFAIVDDGTIYGRELAESFRLAAEQAGLKPAFVDTFRPGLDNQIGLAGRLRRAGATHVFVGGDRSDIAILARDAKGLGFDLTIAGGEALRTAPGDVPLENGVLMIGLPEWAGIATPQVLDFLDGRGIPPEGYVLPGYAALETAATAVVTSATSGTSAAGVLDTRAFETALGTISFDAKGDVTRDFYRLFEYRDGAFVEMN